MDSPRILLNGATFFYRLAIDIATPSSFTFLVFFKKNILTFYCFSKSVNVSRGNGIQQGVGVGSEVGLIGQENGKKRTYGTSRTHRINMLKIATMVLIRPFSSIR